MKEAIEEVIRLWNKATGENVEERKTRFRLGVDYDYTLHEALKCLDDDSTGLLSSIKLRQAFKQFISQNTLTVEDLLNGEWDELKGSMIELKNTLYSGVIGDTYNRFIDLLIKNISELGKDFTAAEINAIEKIEDILVKAVLNFNNKYKFKHEKFTQGELKKQDARILRRLFRFNSFEEFVDSLKATTEDNFICVALCDRTFATGDGSDYDQNYDSQFAIGIKNNGVVYTISDRTILESPSGSYKGRNPGREFFNKVDYDYLPYCKIEEIETATEAVKDPNLLLTYKEEPKELFVKEDLSIVSLFDKVGIIYITTLLTLAYNKYFTNPVNDDAEIQFFGKNIKLLPASGSKELMVIDDRLELPTVPNDVTYDTFIDDPEDKYGIYNNGTFDWLLDVYPLPEQEVKVPTTFIGTKEQAQRNIWWQVRNKQKEHIEKCLKENLSDRVDACEEWFKEQFLKNAESIVNYMLMTKEYDMKDDYAFAGGDFCNHSKQKADKPFICDLYKDSIDFECSTLKEVGESYYYQNYERRKFKPSYPYFEFNSMLGNVKGYYYGRYEPAMWLVDDNDNRLYELKLKLRTWADLKKFFKTDDLPLELKHWLNLNRGWEPYQGNSILDFTDPMNDIRNPYDDISFSIRLYISKTIYNKIQKLHE